MNKFWSLKGMVMKLAVATGMLILSLFLAEGLIRLVAPQPASWLDIYERHPSLPFFSLQPNAVREVDTGESRWSVYTDAEGNRVPVTITETDLPVALILGDSFTFGNGVNYEDSFVGRLNVGLDRAFRIKNTAVPGHGPSQYRQILEHALEVGSPVAAVLVVTYMGNDYYDCIWNKDLPVIDGIIGNEKSLRSFIKRHFHLYRLAAKVYHQTAHTNKDTSNLQENLYQPDSWRVSPLKESLDLYREEFGKIKAICDRESIPLMVFVMPTVDTVRAVADNGQEVKPQPVPTTGTTDYILPNKIAASVLTSLEIATTDLTEVLAQHDTDETYFRFDGHLTPRGNEIVSITMRDRIREVFTDRQ